MRDRPLKLSNGTRLGPYEIVEPLGSGGMGEVYRARDTRLGRTVAIKVLPADVSGSPNSQLRLQREARAIASLSHPNICALYDVGELPGEGRGTQYIVMEYLEGETLEERLRRGPLPVDQAVQYGIEIADALDNAHRRRILHRDLKPSNIMITRNGIRIFDFGLAKIFQFPADENGSSSSGGMTASFLSGLPTLEKSLTTEGSVVGTLEYMAPESLQGKVPDARADVFSLGVCLYQMISGKRPFQGNSRAGLLASILEHDPPPLSVHQPSVSAALDWLVKHCLAKEPDERIQTAHDVKLELKRIADEVRAAVPPKTPSKYKPRFWISAAAVTFATIVIAAFALRIVRSEKISHEVTAVKRFSINLPPSAPLAVGSLEQLAVSPDGTRIAYAGGGEPTRLCLYSMETLDTRQLPETEGAQGPFFSPDGKWIGFYTADRELKKIAVASGTPVLIATGTNIRGATWGPDDTIVFAEPPSFLHRVSPSGGRPELLVAAGLQAQARWPSFLPGGDAVLCTVSDFSGDYDNAKLAVISLKTGRTKFVLNNAAYGRYVRTGYLLYLHAQSLYAVPFDLRQLQVTGTPAPVISDVDSYFSAGLAHFALSADGSLFYVPRDPGEAQRELTWVDRSGKSTAVTDLRRPYSEPKLSPDGKRLLVALGLPPRVDLWLYDLERNAWSRMTTEAHNDSGIWSPDGKQIAFASTMNGRFDLYVMPSDGSAPPKRVTSRNSWDFPSSWSPDGRTIAVIEQYRATKNDIYMVTPQERATPIPFLATPFDEREAVFSPDGRWIAYQSNSSGRDEIYVESYPPTERKWAVSTMGGTNPAWRGDGAELFYRNGDSVMAVEVRAGGEFIAGKPRALFRGDFETEYDVTRDGQRFIMIRRGGQSARTRIDVVLGLFENMKTNLSE